MPICSATYSCLRRWASSRLSEKSPSYLAPLKSASSPMLSRKIRSISEYVNSRSAPSATAGHTTPATVEPLGPRSAVLAGGWLDRAERGAGGIDGRGEAPGGAVDRLVEH